MKNQKMRLIIGVVLGVVVLFYIGAMFGFFPFTLCDDLVIRAVAFCTLIICLVIAVCTCFIIDFLGRHRIIWQDDSVWDFSSSQGLENEGILCVFLVFQTTELAEKTRRGTQTQLCGDALKNYPPGRVTHIVRIRYNNGNCEGRERRWLQLKYFRRSLTPAV